ncbi:biotin transporter BioY [Bacillus solimangrovi]|uniref:Biotin transporter n=1 Tax=Bacillus solimangrovi TaxID=1305675 RepID=A0A1E5LIX9_9BACI|nr:biotin transporter BioY [Bacillus solimangrovi]OEH93996.1 BioY family transporter [Bacillus solimangrovi]
MSSNKPRFRTVDLTLAAMFVALMAIGANITSWAPFLQVANVPLSMQPFFAILAGVLLGSRLGSLSMIVYLLVGIAGAPVFAKFGAGIGVIFGSTGGFLLSYIFAAYAAGKVMERTQKPNKATFYIASFVGIILIYIIGTNFMYASLNIWIGAEMGYLTAWQVMMPFAIKDVVFTALGAAIAPRIYHAIRRSGSLNNLNRTA